MAVQRKHPEELRERAVKMVLEIRERDGKGVRLAAPGTPHSAGTHPSPRSQPQVHAGYTPRTPQVHASPVPSPPRPLGPGLVGAENYVT